MSRAFIAGDPRFFAKTGPHRLADIAARIDATLEAVHADRMISGIAPLQTARPDQISFLDNRKYTAELAASAAGAVIIHPDMQKHAPSGCVPLLTRNPYAGWAAVAGMFHPPRPTSPGIHPTALVDASAVIDTSAEIGPYAVIGARVEVGAHCTLGAGVVIGEGVIIGAHTRIDAHVSISHAFIGSRVHLFPGVRIGQEGFGFATIMQPTGPTHLTVPQLGCVHIEDDVEVGANTCIDRGSSQDTRIGAGSRIDNQVQIGHNVHVGRACVIVAQVGISGSTVLEDFVVIAGQAGLAGHLRIGRGARIGGMAGVMTDVPAGAEYVGSPAQPAKTFFREVVTLRKLVEERAALRAARNNNPAAGGPAPEPADKAGAD